MGLTLPLFDGVADLDTGEVRRPGADDRLSTTELALLRFLVERAGQPVARETLLEEVWGYHKDTATRTVDIAVRRLRLKLEPDPHRPQHILTVHGEGYRFCPAAERSGRFPHYRDTFVGRAIVRERLLDRLASGQLVTLLGPGGQGKTRLASAVGRAFHEQGHDAAFCDLSHAQSVDDVLGSIATGLGLTLAAGSRDGATEQLHHAIAARGPVLLVLDNAEAVVEPLVAVLVQALTACPQACWLVTSRERLKLSGEVVVPLEPLDLADAEALFVARVEAAGGRVSEEDPSTLAQLLPELEGAPLAIELAAARVPALGLEALVERLQTHHSEDAADPATLAARGEDRLAVFVGGPRDAPPRHRSLAATIAWSWELLSDDEQDALARCAVFRGAFSVHAAEAVAETSLATLEALHGKSLILRRNDRLRLADSIRAFALSRLGARERRPDSAETPLARACRAHMQWFAKQPAEASGDEANRLAAFDHALHLGERAIVVSLARNLAERAWRRGPAERGLAVLDRALAAVESEHDPETNDAEWGELGVRRAEILRLLGERRPAQAALDALLADPARLSPLWEARARRERAHLHRHAGELTEARALLEQGLRGLTDPAAVAVLQLGIGVTALAEHDPAGAITAYGEALAYYETSGDAESRALVLGFLGTARLEAGHLLAARDNFTAAAALHRSQGDPRREAEVLSNLAVLLHELGALDDAAECHQSAWTMHRRVGNRRFEGFALGALGFLEHARGNLGQARELATQSLSIFRALHDRRFEAIALVRLALVEAESPEASATPLARSALDEARRLGGLTPQTLIIAERMVERRPLPPPEAAPTSFERLLTDLHRRRQENPG